MNAQRLATYALIVNIFILILFAVQVAVVSNYLKRDLERTQWVIVPEEKPPPPPDSGLRNV